MKSILLIILLIGLVVFFGTWPLSILGTIFRYIGTALTWLASALNIFGWNGIV